VSSGLTLRATTAGAVRGATAGAPAAGLGRAGAPAAAVDEDGAAVARVGRAVPSVVPLGAVGGLGGGGVPTGLGKGAGGGDAPAGAPAAGMEGSLMVAVEGGLGGKLIRTVSFFGCTFMVSVVDFGGTEPLDKLEWSSAI
jgi:hypothetical protein